MRDDPDFNIDLVQEIEKFPCLYDPTHVDYTKRNVQDRVWRELAEKMGEPVDALKSRWKNLRSRHYKVKNHSMSGAVKRKSYYLAEYLQFLDKVGESRPSEETFYDVHDVLKVEVDDASDQDARRADVTMFREHSQMSQNTGMSETSDDDAVQVVDDRKTPAGRGPRLNNGSCVNELKRRQATPGVKARASPAAFVQGAEQLSLHDPDMAFLYSLVPDVKMMREDVKRKFKVRLLQLVDETLSNP